MSTYKIIDDFQANAVRVLILDRDYERIIHKLTIDGVEYPFQTNSMKNWLIIRSTNSFKGKTAVLT
jgi:hypothetical protein